MHATENGAFGYVILLFMICLLLERLNDCMCLLLFGKTCFRICVMTSPCHDVGKVNKQKPFKGVSILCSAVNVMMISVTRECITFDF